MKSSSTPTSTAPTSTEDGGLAIVRIKPIGAGGGGVERSGIGMKDGEAALRWSESGRIDIVAGKVNGKSFDYMTHVIPPETDNEALHNFFMPRRIDAFLDGYNVNVMAYGQTGSGKTHTMFGTPGILERAGRGEYGTSIHPDYGLFPRSLLAIFERYKQLRMSSSNKRYVLTANALELSMMLGNRDLLNVKNKGVDPKLGNMMGRATQYGVCIDRTAKPARMFGMEELTLETDDNLFTFLLGMSERCTSGTGQNQHSSRSHCFVTLTLYCYDNSDETLTKSRLQFVDLAGSEKMKNAHGNSDYRASSASVQGMLVNYSLTMLGCAVRDLVTFRKKQKKKIKSSSSSATEGGCGKKKKTKQFSFRNYMFDLIMLLSQSLTGEALTAVFVCVSQAPDNASTTFNALNFGESFGQLSLRKKRVTPIQLTKIYNDTKKLLDSATKALKANPPEAYRVQREGQVTDCVQRLKIYDVLLGGGGGGKNKK